jgi:hypothetical protein
VRKLSAVSLLFAGSMLSSGIAATSAAAVQLTSQSRSVHAESSIEASLFGPNPFDSPLLTLQDADSADASASDFGPFDGDVASASPDVLPFPLIGTGAASQMSSLSATSLSASASTDVVSDGDWLSEPQVAIVNEQLAPPTFSFVEQDDTSTGESLFSVSFDVSAPTPYTLTGSLGVSSARLFGAGGVFTPLTTAAGSIELRHALGGSVAQIQIDQLDFCVFDPQSGEGSCSPGSLPLSAQGLLAPGSYVLEATATSSAETTCHIVASVFDCRDSSSDASFTLDLTFGPPFAPAVPVLGPTALGLLSLALAAGGGRALRRAHA